MMTLQLRPSLALRARSGKRARSKRSFAIALPLDLLEARLLPSGMPATTNQALAAYGQMPISFEPNLGQTAQQVDFLSRGNGYTFFLQADQSVLALRPASGTQGDVLSTNLVGANADARPLALDPQASTSNYFIGNNPASWQTNVPNLGRVEYDGVYPGIDLTYYGTQGQIEYDFGVAPGADPSTIRLSFQGAQGLSLDDQGNLIVHLAGGDLVEHAPVLYQNVNGAQQPVRGSYALLDNGQVGFQVGPYDHSLPLVIDPVLSYSTFLGGSLGDKAFAIAADSAGNVYITGETGSTNFPTTPGAFSTTNHGSNTVTDAFVTKLSPTGQLVYSTFLGGSSDDHGTGIAIDSQGNAYMCGWTQQSTDYPTTPGSFQPNYNHLQDGFVTKLNPTGSALVYSTYLGGGSDDEPHAIAVDSQGFAYVAGDTFSTDFPTQNPIQGGVFNSNDDAFVSKLNQAGSALIYSTYIRGSANDAGTGVAVTPAGEAIVVGTTSSTNFPTTANAFQKTRGGDPAQNVSNTFVTKINAAGNGYVYSTYLGGSIGNQTDVSNGGPAVATDSTGAAYVTGDTFDPDFPVTIDAAQQVKNYTDMFGLTDAFVAKFSATGSLVYSTYLGGGGNNTSDGGRGIAVDAQGNAYITGFTADTSTPFPTAFAFQPNQPGNFDAFVTRVSADGSNFDYSSFLGGQTFDYGRGIAIDGNGNAYVVGLTKSTQSGVVDNFPTLNAIKSAPPATFDTDGFVTRVNLLEPGAGTFYFPFVTYETTEAGSFITIQVDRRNGDSSAASVNFSMSNGSAHAGTNFTSQSGTLNFAAGEHEKTFTIPILDDHTNNGTPFLTFHLALSGPTGGAVVDAAASTADVLIYDDQTTHIDNDLFNNAVPLVGQNPTATGTNVNATTNQGGDDQFDFPVTSGDVTAPKNAGGASVWWIWSPPSSGQTTIDTFGSNFDTLITVFSHGHVVENDDAPGVSDGTSKVTFQAHAGIAYRICVQGFASGGGVATGNIVLHFNGVASGTLQFTQPSYNVFENGGSVIVPVTRTGGSTGAVSVQVTTSNGTATAGTDYTAVNQTLNWAAGDTSTKNVTIPVLDDGAVDNLSETFTVALTNAGGGASVGSPGSAVVVILEPVVNNGSLSLSQATYSVSETAGNIVIPVNRTGGSTGAVSVLASTSNGTALAGTDFTDVSQTLNWADGDTAPKNISIPILDDGGVNPTNETFNVTLTSPTGGATLTAPSSAVVTIVEPEVLAGIVQFNSATYNAGETSGSALVTVTRTVGSTGAISVHYATSNGTATAGNDYTATSGTLNWANGDTASKTFSIPILNDNLVDGNETVNLTLSNPTGGAALGSPSTAVLTIVEPPKVGTRGDYDGDGKADLAVFRPSTGTFYVKQSTLGGEHIQFGTLGDTPLQGDINGDGKADFILFRRATATFFVKLSGSGATSKLAFGAPNLDIPVLGDYDGDGKTDLAVFRPTTDEWFVALATGGHMHVTFGQPGVDRPEPADYNGDGKADFAVYRPTTNQFLMMGIGKVTIGAPGDIAVPAAYDGGAAEPAVFRPSTDQWIIDGPGGVFRTLSLGQFNDQAVPNDYNGDGKADLATYRFASATWFIAGGGPATTFGGGNIDYAVPRALDYITFSFGTTKAPAGGSNISAFDLGRQANALASRSAAGSSGAVLVVIPGTSSNPQGTSATGASSASRAPLTSPNLLAPSAAVRPPVARTQEPNSDDAPATSRDASLEPESSMPTEALASLARVRIERFLEGS